MALKSQTECMFDEKYSWMEFSPPVRHVAGGINLPPLRRGWLTDKQDPTTKLPNNFQMMIASSGGELELREDND